jgi:hypothetical protein
MIPQITILSTFRIGKMPEQLRFEPLAKFNEARDLCGGDSQL